MTCRLEFTLILLSVFLPFFGEGVPIFLRGKWTGKDGMGLLITNSSGEGAPDQWYTDQLLDHFDPDNKKVWKQRYWVNDSNWDRESGPVFMFIGGEGEANNVWLQFGEMIDLAVKYHGLAVIFEHR